MQHGLDLARGNVLAAAHDHVLLAIDDGEVAALVEPAEVAGVQPAVDDRRGRCGLVVEVARHHLVAAHGDLADRAGRECRTAVVDDAELDQRRRPARALQQGAVVEGALVVGRVEVRTIARELGHAVALREPATERRHGALQERRGDRRGAVREQAQ